MSVDAALAWALLAVGVSKLYVLPKQSRSTFVLRVCGVVAAVMVYAQNHPAPSSLPSYFWVAFHVMSAAQGLSSASVLHVVAVVVASLILVRLLGKGGGTANGGIMRE